MYCEKANSMFLKYIGWKEKLEKDVNDVELEVERYNLPIGSLRTLMQYIGHFFVLY